MPIKFPSDEWIKALMAELNQSPAYREAAQHWEGDFCFVVTNGEGDADTTYLYMDLWHGECRAAQALPALDGKSPEFIIEASLPMWRRVIERKADPIQSLMTRQLKLTGNLIKVMRAPKAAAELVKCCTMLDTEWPE
jgi:putative sterol carrier protein